MVPRKKSAYPLRVAVYEDIAKRIRGGDLHPGRQLPSEDEIAKANGVSRLTAREALLLLEEDGYIQTMRGRGRYVADRLPDAGLEGLRTVASMLSDRKKLALVRQQSRIEEATKYLRDSLELDDGEQVLLLENELQDETGAAACLSLEWIPMREGLTGPPEATVGSLESSPGSLLDFVLANWSDGIRYARYSVSVTTAGRTRGRRLAVEATAPVMLLVQVAYHELGPIYTARHVLRSDVAHFTGTQGVTIM